jgi:hypothetical protein
VRFLVCPRSKLQSSVPRDGSHSPTRTHPDPPRSHMHVRMVLTPTRCSPCPTTLQAGGDSAASPKGYASDSPLHPSARPKARKTPPGAGVGMPRPSPPADPGAPPWHHLAPLSPPSGVGVRWATPGSGAGAVRGAPGAAPPQASLLQEAIVAIQGQHFRLGDQDAMLDHLPVDLDATVGGGAVVPVRRWDSARGGCLCGVLWRCDSVWGMGVGWWSLHVKGSCKCRWRVMGSALTLCRAPNTHTRVHIVPRSFKPVVRSRRRPLAHQSPA